MISYSTNFMGPISLEWYRDRGIDHKLQQYAGGRIDVYGVSEDDYYEGRTAIGLPIMKVQCFNSLSAFLKQFTSSMLLSYDDLIMLYYAEGNPQIEYAPGIKVI
jgi:hypothetical protein